MSGMWTQAEMPSGIFGIGRNWLNAIANLFNSFQQSTGWWELHYSQR